MRRLLLLAAACALGHAAAIGAAATTRAADEPIVLAVMDPLAAPLSCDCVKGYAQRDYGRLADYLERQLGRKVRVVYGEDLARLVRAEAARGGPHFIIGKQSVVRYDAAELRLKLRMLCLLTDQMGDTNVYGLFVVRSGDPARAMGDLKGYTIYFGPEDSVEKHAAAMAALKAAGVQSPAQPEVRGSCGEAALAMLESTGPAAAVISSYAQATLEGCGTVEKGALRLVGKTAAVPFVTMFATEAVDAALGDEMARALLGLRDAALLAALESLHGFVRPPAVEAHAPSDHAPSASPASPSPDNGAAPPSPGDRAGPAATAAEAKAERVADDWPEWRGANRDGTTPWLPDSLPTETTWLWRRPLGNTGLGGLAVADGRVVVPDRDPLDTSDVFRSFDAKTGKPLWQVEYPAPGRLDYGNSPRTTPLIRDGKVFTLGAMGDLYCLALDDGTVLWKTNLPQQFGGKLPTWGMCASPLLVGDLLIANPGAPTASVVALDATTGRLVWKAPGAAAAYASFIAGRFGGAEQIVGYDAISAAGFEARTGRRLWTLLPEHKGDFNVPTPLNLGGMLLLTSENNGTRLYRFGDQGRLEASPVAVFEDLAPDSSTPLCVAGRVFGCWNGLYCLDARDLKPLWIDDDQVYEHYASLIGSADRVLVVSSRGELFLYDAAAAEKRRLGRLRIGPPDVDILAHPAVSAKRLFVRVGREVGCLALDPR